jgi:hypothetical protein
MYLYIYKECHENNICNKFIVTNHFENFINISENNNSDEIRRTLRSGNAGCYADQKPIFS